MKAVAHDKSAQYSCNQEAEQQQIAFLGVDQRPVRRMAGSPRELFHHGFIHPGPLAGATPQQKISANHQYQNQQGVEQ